MANDTVFPFRRVSRCRCKCRWCTGMTTYRGRIGLTRVGETIPGWSCLPTSRTTSSWCPGEDGEAHRVVCATLKMWCAPDKMSSPQAGTLSQDLFKALNNHSFFFLCVVNNNYICLVECLPNISYLTSQKIRRSDTWPPQQGCVWKTAQHSDAPNGLMNTEQVLKEARAE